MTKVGYTHIIVPTQLHDQLKTLAQQNSISIAQLLTQLIKINVNVNVGVSINTSINTAQRTIQKQSVSEALNQEKSPNQPASNKMLVGLPGFEPGSFPHKAYANALREPKSPSLDQTSRQPRLHAK